MQKIRNLIAARNAKIAEMQKNYEPSERIRAYKETSLKVVQEDYRAIISELQKKNDAAQEAIASEYQKKRPSQRELADQVTILRTQYRAMTPQQLDRASEALMTVPPGVFPIEDYHALGSEMRDRGLIDQADNLSIYTEVQKIATPYVNDGRYRALEKAGQRLTVLAAQSSEILILSPDLEKIGKDDVISLKDLDKVTS
jgi:hypothetical protein